MQFGEVIQFGNLQVFHPPVTPTQERRVVNKEPFGVVEASRTFGCSTSVSHGGEKKVESSSEETSPQNRPIWTWFLEEDFLKVLQTDQNPADFTNRVFI